MTQYISAWERKEKRKRVVAYVVAAIACVLFTALLLVVMEGYRLLAIDTVQEMRK